MSLHSSRHEFYFYSWLKRWICSCRYYTKPVGIDMSFKSDCDNCFGKGVEAIPLKDLGVIDVE